EQQLRRNLNLARPIGLRADGAEGAVPCLGIREPKLDAVEGVEDFYAELSVPSASMEIIILEQREVDIFHAVGAQIRHDARCVAELERGSDGKRARVEPFPDFFVFASAGYGRVLPVPHRALAWTEQVGVVHALRHDQRVSAL